MENSMWRDTCDTLSRAAKLYDNNNIITDGKGIILADGLDKYGVVVKKGIEFLAAELGCPLRTKVIKYTDTINIYNEFTYNGVCFYSDKFVHKDEMKKDKDERTIIYDNTIHGDD